MQKAIKSMRRSHANRMGRRVMIGMRTSLFY